MKRLLGQHTKGAAQKNEIGAEKGHSKIYETAMLITALSLFSTVLGFVREMAMAYFFGASAATDVFIVALMIPNFIYITILGGAMNAGLVSTFTGLEGGARDKTYSSFTNSCLLALGVLTVAGVIFAPALADLFAPWLSLKDHGEVVRFTRITFPIVVFLGVSGVATAALNSKKFFIGPVSAQALQNLFFVSATVALAAALGPFSMVVGIVAGMFLQMTLLVFLVKKAGIKYSPSAGIKDENSSRAWKMMLPIILTAGLGGEYSTQYFNVVTARFFASGLEEGSITALSYANKILSIPIFLVSYSIATVLLPYLSECFNYERHDEAKSLLKRTICFMALVLAPMVIVLALLSEPITRVLLERGAFMRSDTLRTAGALNFYVLSVFGMGASFVLIKFFHAMKKTKIPTAVGVACVILNIALMALLKDKLGLNGIAFAISVSSIANALILFILLKRRMKGASVMPAGFFLKLAAASLLMGWVLFALRPGLDGQAAGTFVKTALCASAGLLAYGAALYALKVEEFHSAIGWARRRLARG